MTAQTLYDRVFDAHLVEESADGTCQLYVGMHYVNDVTSSEAFAALARRGLPVARPDRTVAIVDHVVPETGGTRPYRDLGSELLADTLEGNAERFGLPLLAPGSGRQGIVHVVGPESGLTQPGMVVCCGDSHTSAHGALGALGFGIGTSQVRDVLASQSLLTRRLGVRQVRVGGTLAPGVEAKDVIIALIRRLGVRGGIGLAYEYAGPVVEAMSMDERMTLCAMSIEGGAQVGYVCPDDRTVHYLAERLDLPSGRWAEAEAWWRSLPSDAEAAYADTVALDGGALAPMVTWGVHPGQSVRVDEPVPARYKLADPADDGDALEFMQLPAGRPLLGTPIDVAFVGSCANGRLGDIARVVELVRRTGRRVAPRVRAVVTPGSEPVAREMARRGWDELLADAGFVVGLPGCSLCIGMNGSPLVGDQLCASTSTRNFKGRQGSPTGRTILMSPATVAAAALAGEVVDVRDGWLA